MEGIIRCVTDKGQERYIPVKMTKDSALMKQYGLTVQDLEVEKAKIEVPEIVTEKKKGRPFKEEQTTDGIPNE